VRALEGLAGRVYTMVILPVARSYTPPTMSIFFVA
jgi:hypothetical protein